MRAAFPAAFWATSFFVWPICGYFLLTSPACAQQRLALDEGIEQRERKIEETLTKRGSVDFVESPLRDVVAELSRQFQIPIVLAVKKMEEASVSPDAPVTKQVEDLSLESILSLILRDLELEYSIRDEVLLITTPEDNESNLDTRTYPVLDLVTSRKARSSFFVGGDYDSLIELITATIKPDSWDDVGGPGAIDALDNAGSLVISQTQMVHRQVERLLTSLRAAKRTQGISSLPVPTSVSRRVYADEKERAGFRTPVEAAPMWQVPQVYR